MEVYCGIDLHARRSQVCVIDQAGEVLVNRKVPNRIDVILEIPEAFGEGIPVTATGPNRSPRRSSSPTSLTRGLGSCCGSSGNASGC
jgi:hypothetical protein